MSFAGLRRILLVVACCLGASLATPAWTEEAWRAEFDETCSKTDDAMALTEGELVVLTERCDRLEKVIAGLGETERKVFGKRLQMCRNLYQFVLETRRSERVPK